MEIARYPTTDEWIKKMGYTYAMEHYSVIKKTEILLFTGKWIELEKIMLNEVSQVQKDKSHTFSLICGRQIQIQITSIIIYRIYTYRTCFQLWDYQKRQGEEGKKKRMIHGE
jgi:hypothetical protein